ETLTYPMTSWPIHSLAGSTMKQKSTQYLCYTSSRTYFVNDEVLLELSARLTNILSGVRKGATMSLEENKTVVRRFLEEVVVQGNFEVFDTCFAPDVVHHLYNTPPHSHASWRELLRQSHQAMAGHSVTIHDLIAEGDTVAARYSYAA